MNSLYGKNIIPILLLIASIWTGFGFLYPRYGTIEELRSQKAQYASALDDANQARIIRSTLEAQENSISTDDWHRLGVMLPAESNGVALARDVDGLASIFGIHIDSVSFADVTSSDQQGAGGGAAVSAPAAAPADATGMVSADAGAAAAAVQSVNPLGTLELKIKFTSTYANFTNFLRELEKSLELSDVTSVTLGGGGEPASGQSQQLSATNSYTFEVTMHTYWLKGSGN